MSHDLLKNKFPEISVENFKIMKEIKKDLKEYNINNKKNPIEFGEINFNFIHRMFLADVYGIRPKFK